mmetsp:Transcript_38373/g.114932  ORF Transcript_38373/g.114932 Transcript_38373/m.114932 type:complete len:100 (-) Transcript_38373:628-927(-)
MGEIPLLSSASPCGEVLRTCGSGSKIMVQKDKSNHKKSPRQESVWFTSVDATDDACVDLLSNDVDAFPIYLFAGNILKRCSKTRKVDRAPAHFPSTVGR